MCVCSSFRLKSLRHVCVYLCAQVLVCMCVLISKIVSCVLVSKLVRLAHSISSQAKVKAPWHGVSSEGEFIDNCITVLLCLTIGLQWPLNWNGLKVVDNVSRIVYAVVLIFSV